MGEHRNRRRVAAPHRKENGHLSRVAAHLGLHLPSLLDDAEHVRRGIGPTVIRRAGIKKGETHALVRPPARTPRRSGPAKVVYAERIALTLRHHLVAHLHPLALSWGYREDPRAQQPLSHPLDQRRILLLPDDFLVDAARFDGIHRLACRHLAVDLQCQVLKRGASRQRKQVVGLADHAAAVDELLIDFVAEHAVRKAHPHPAR